MSPEKKVIKMPRNHPEFPHMRFTIWPILLLIVIGAVILIGPWAVVPPGHVGVKIFLGSVKDEVFAEGFHMTICQVAEVSTQSQSYSVEYDANNPNAAVTSDLQTVGFRVNVAYYVNGADAARELVKFVNRDPSTWARNLIDPAILQSVKVVFSSYTLRSVVENREDARREIAELISDLVNERMVERSETLDGAILVTQVTLDNIDYSDEFERVIEMTQQEEQRVRFAENELNRIRIEAQQQVAQAEAARLAAVEQARGQAEAAVERARGDALALLIENEAQVQAYAALAAAGIAPNTYRFTEIWDGRLPTFLGGGESLGMILNPTSEGELDMERLSIIVNDLRSARERLEAMTALRSSAEGM